MRKVIFGIALLLVLTTGVHAANLTELRAQALGTNYDYKIAELNVELAKRNLIDAEAQGLLEASVVHITDAKQKLTAATRNLAVVEQKVILAIDQCYYELVCLEKKATILHKTQQIGLEQLRIVEAKHDAGLATNIDKMRAEIAVKYNQMEMYAIKHQKQAAQQQMLTLLGASIEAEIQPTDTDFYYQECSLMHQEQAILQQQLVQYNPSLAIYIERVNLARLEEETGQISDLPPLYQEINTFQRQIVELEYEDGVAQLMLQILDLQAQVQQAEKIYHIRVQEEKLAAKNEIIIQLRLAEGLETDLVSLQAENSVLQAQLETLTALFDYNVLRSQLENLFVVRE